jgi:hypothetical protein
MGRRVNSEGSISRRKDGRWMARYSVETPDGTKHKTLYGKTRKEPADRLTEALAGCRAPSGFTTCATPQRPCCWGGACIRNLYRNYWGIRPSQLRWIDTRIGFRLWANRQPPRWKPRCPDSNAFGLVSNWCQ